MSPAAKRNFWLLTAVLLMVGACIAFPRVLAFVELASRELRYLWWLVLIFAFGAWLAFFLGRKDR